MPDRRNRWERLISGKERRYLWRLHAVLPERGSTRAALAAVALLGLAEIIKPLADSWTGQTLPPFIFAYPIVVIAALVAGPRMGVLVAFVSIAYAWIVSFAPAWSFELSSTGDLVALLLYSAMSIFLALTVGLARYTLDLAVASEAVRDYDAREAVHRVKNVLAVVQAMALGTMREASDLRDFGQRLFPRIDALAKAQEILVNFGTGSCGAHDMISAAVRPFLPDPRIQLDCHEEVTVPAPYVHGLMLALFELATNSAKYGALGTSAGSIAISCKQHEHEAVLQWHETATVADSTGQTTATQGFGRRLIEAALRQDKDTSVSYDCSNGNVTVIFRWPLATSP